MMIIFFCEESSVHCMRAARVMKLFSWLFSIELVFMVSWAVWSSKVYTLRVSLSSRLLSLSFIVSNIFFIFLKAVVVTGWLFLTA